MRKKLVLVFLACILFAGHINGLYEDQVGTYDWRQQYIGRPLYSHIDTSLNKVILASDQNVLAGVNLKTGKLAWRKIFESGAVGQIDYVLWGTKEAIVITNSGQRIQSFDYNHGFANWEYSLFHADPVKKSKIFGVESKHDSETYYFTNGYQMCYVSVKDNTCVELPLDDGYFYTNIFETEHGVFVTGTKGNLIQKLQYNSLLSSLLSKTITVQSDNFKFDNCLKTVDSNQLVCYAAQENKLYVSQIKAGGNKMEFEQIYLGASDMPSDASLIWALTKDVYLFKSKDNQKSSLYLFKQQNQEVSFVKKFDDFVGFDLASKGSAQFLVYGKYLGPGKLNFYVVDLKTGQERTDMMVSVNTNEKEPKSILLMNAHLLETKNSQLNLNILCCFDDHSVSFYNNQGVKYFTREEALAYIVSVEMVDFPLTHLQEEFEDEFGHVQQDNILQMFYKRIRTQFVQLKEFILIDLSNKIQNYLNSNTNLKRGSSSSSSPGSGGLSADEITRDEFNLNKLIVAVTSIGKVFGIYTGSNGKILWSFYLKNTLPFKLNKLKNDQSIPFFVQRTAAHFPYEPQCVLISKIQIGDKLKTRIYYFNPITGQTSKDQPKEGLIVDYQLKQAFLSTHQDEQFLKPLFLFDQDNILHVLPEKLGEELTSKSTKTSVIYSTSLSNDKTNSLVGYAVKHVNKPLPEVWRLSLEDETIIAIGSKLHNDHIHSHGKVLGDRSVLYKYLNPNLIGVVTTGQDSQKVSFVNVYLIDTVTGSIINSFNHKRCKGPVHIVHSENWFFYSYYNLKYRRNEVASVELFEGGNQFNSTHFSSMDDIKPITYTKSYIVQRSFDSMQVTVTEKGITTKDVIVACQYGVIIEIPWILIDPRRPIKMTETDREENLIPYMPEIPLNYEFSLNYYNYVYNVRGITTAPSGLESTSLVFTYGLDIYFTRVFPSKTFDMLREDFDFFFVTTVLVGLVLGTVVSKKLASSSNLKKAWK